jgi:hypothetical protein
LDWLGELTGKGFWLTELDVFGNDEHVCAVSVMGTKRPDIDVRTRVVSAPAGSRFTAGPSLPRRPVGPTQPGRGPNRERPLPFPFADCSFDATGPSCLSDAR